MSQKMIQKVGLLAAVMNIQGFNNRMDLERQRWWWWWWWRWWRQWRQWRWAGTHSVRQEGEISHLLVN